MAAAKREEVRDEDLTGLKYFHTLRPSGTVRLRVCAHLAAPDICERETRALLVGAKEHPGASLHLVALTTDSPPPLPEDVTLHRAATWLLV